MPTPSGKAPRGDAAAHAFTALRTLFVGLDLGLGLAAAAPAQAADRWAADEFAPRAVLPDPTGATTITGGTLSCEAQRWSLDLVLAEGAPAGEGVATLDIDGRVFEAKAASADGGLRIAVPRATIEPLKAGIRLALGIDGELAAAFALRGSRIAITAAQDRCTLRDMSAYTPATFTPYTSYLGLARALRKDDIAGFRLSTASEPELTAAMAEFDGGRRVLFTRLCGSSWYYGASGCNITGFAPDGDDGWRSVYDTENVHLYTDPGAVTDGWPDIVTLPARNVGPGLVWRWDGHAYALKGALPEEEDGE